MLFFTFRVGGYSHRRVGSGKTGGCGGGTVQSICFPLIFWYFFIKKKVHNAMLVSLLWLFLFTDIKSALKS